MHRERGRLPRAGVFFRGCLMEESGPRLLLVDGHNLIYRSFFAIRGLSTAEGMPTNAIFGFIRAVRSLLDSWKPTHFAAVFDGGLPPERLELLREYKAARPPMPDDLRRQIDPVMDWLRLRGLRALRADKVEADDLMASLAVRFPATGGEVLIGTSDKDLYQLVNARVLIVPLSARDPVYDAAGVREKTGVPPERIVDYLALIGDAVDNIPGARGVGPKTAARLLASCGSLEELYERLDACASPKVAASLREARDLVFLNRDLIRLRTDLPVETDWDAYRPTPADTGGLLAFYRAHELKRLAEELASPALW
jgi:DNA polymerase I